jgi:hypothetical protein
MQAFNVTMKKNARMIITYVQNMYEHIMYSPHVCIAYVYGTWMNVDE